MDKENLTNAIARLLVKNWKEDNDQEERYLLLEAYDELVPKHLQMYRRHLPYTGIDDDDDLNYDYDPELDDEGDGDYNGHDDCEGFQSHDLSDDAEALASAGFGTDEDYGCYGDDGW